MAKTPGRVPSLVVAQRAADIADRARVPGFCRRREKARLDALHLAQPEFVDLFGRPVGGDRALHRHAVHGRAVGQGAEPVRGARARQVFLAHERRQVADRREQLLGEQLAIVGLEPPARGLADRLREARRRPPQRALLHLLGRERLELRQRALHHRARRGHAAQHARAHLGGDALQVGRVALQAPEPGAVVGFVAERLAVYELHQVERHAAVQLDEEIVLVERVRQPIKRVVRAVGDQLVRQLLARPELAGRNPLQRLQDPAVVRALALAVLRGKRELEPVLARAGAAPEGLAEREQIERALGRFLRQALQALRRALRRA